MQSSSPLSWPPPHASPLEIARDKQDRAALTELAAQASAAAAKAPNDAEAQYRAALANSYLAEVAHRTARPKAGRQVAEQGIKFAEKAVALKPANAEYYRCSARSTDRPSPIS